jgi:hypothetical protein
MGASACSCAPSSEEGRHPPEEIAVATVSAQAELEEREHSFTDLTEARAGDLSRSQRSVTEPCLASKEPCHGEPGTAASGLPTSLLMTAQLTVSFVRRLRHPAGALSLARARADPPRQPARPDLSGDWLLHRLEGDVEALLKEVGASWVKRKAAAAMGFGVGMQFVRVEQHPNTIRIDTSYRGADGREDMAWLKPTKNCYSTDGVEQNVADPEGRFVRTSVAWDGEALMMVSRRVDCGKPLPSTRRYLQGDGKELVFEQTSPATGVVVKRIFKRCETGGSGASSASSGKSRSS